MSAEEKKAGIRDIMAAFIDHTSKHLPDDVLAGLKKLKDNEDDPLALEIYDLMFRNLRMAAELDRPSCQDTGVLQFWIRCGPGFPYIGELESILTDAVRKATAQAPLRFNVVETFEEYNTGTNTGTGAPTFWWDIVPDWDGCEIYTYMAGGGCSLPGSAMVLMPGQGYQEAVRFVLDRMTSYGLNACPPLFVGVGIGTSVETAALNAKKRSCALSAHTIRMNAPLIWSSFLKTVSMLSASGRREWEADSLSTESTSLIPRAIRLPWELLSQ